MKYFTEKCIVIIYLCCSLLKSAHSIDCYQCSGADSEHPFNCNEYLNADTDLLPTNCSSIHNAQFCIKQVGRSEGGISTKRFCSSLDLGNDCRYVQHTGDRLEYRTCVYTCSSDACNSAVSPHTSTLAILSSVAIALLSKRA